MSSRRSYALTLAACLAGSALAAYAVTRTWSLQLTPRTGMTDLRTARTGTDASPWVIGLALVALAGTGALLATRGAVRRALGFVLVLAGLGAAVGAIVGRAGVDPGAAGTAATVWPVLCVLGGLVIAAGGVTAARLGHRWPEMSARYDRKPVTPAQYSPSERQYGSSEEEKQHSPSEKQKQHGPSEKQKQHGPSEKAKQYSRPETTSDPDLAPADHRAAWDALDRGDDPTG